MTSVLGVDVGGTFTDFLLSEDGLVRAHKRPSTPDDPSRAVLEGIDELGVKPELVVHGSTVATNAVLERRGARTALVATNGMRDLLQIGRQSRPDIYDLEPETPEPLVAPELRFELTGQLNPDGSVARALDVEQARDVISALTEQGTEALAVSLLYAYFNPELEQQFADLLPGDHNIYLSLSAVVSPEYREVERTQTTVLNAYVGPAMSRYLERLSTGLLERGCGPLRIVQSDGGSADAERAARRPVSTLLSGPSAGVAGAFEIAREAGYGRIITFDMGGTSTDVALCDGAIPTRPDVVVGGLAARTPVVDVFTVGAGGGSIARIDTGGALRVGPQSAGASPGPASYGTGDALTVTDAQVVLGRLGGDALLGGSIALDRGRARAAAERMGGSFRDVERAAEAVIAVATANMEGAVRVVSVQRGHDPREFTLVAFGGAGPLHACALAEALELPRVLVPLLPGVLAAQGAAGSDVTATHSRSVLRLLEPRNFRALREALLAAGREVQAEPGLATGSLRYALDLRYQGQSYELSVDVTPDQIDAALLTFHEVHERRFAHSDSEAAVEVVNVRATATVRGTPLAASSSPLPPRTSPGPEPRWRSVWFGGERVEAAVYERSDLIPGDQLFGPALVEQLDTTTLLPPGWSAEVDATANLVLEREPVSGSTGTGAGELGHPELGAADLAIADAVLSSIAGEMGEALGRTAYSPNIKERRDFSCAIFNGDGQMVAQAAHMPVHLGAMPTAVRQVMELAPFAPGDVLALNDPFRGGTHLPDLTTVSPVFSGDQLVGFAATRAHHADIGGMAPGSMPVARELLQEGLVIPPIRLVDADRPNEAAFALIVRNSRAPEERRGDLRAQMAATVVGVRRLEAAAERFGRDGLLARFAALLDHGDRVVRQVISGIPDGQYHSEDRMEVGPEGLKIRLMLTIRGDEAHFDFSGTDRETEEASINAVAAVTQSACYYTIRCLAGHDAPRNEGCYRPITFTLPERSLVAAGPPRAVSAGNVETSQRITDVALRALALALPDRIPAASSGTMNNVTIGGFDRARQRPYAYYETIAGGAGGGPRRVGRSGVHTHMTNTMNTPIEALPLSYPFTVERYELRPASGGAGWHAGGDGILREYLFGDNATVSLVTERRRFRPWGLAGGEAGAAGRNTLIRADGSERDLGARAQVDVGPGDRVRIESPGGGGWGPASSL